MDHYARLCSSGRLKLVNEGLNEGIKAIMNEFVSRRENIDLLIQEARSWIEHKSISGSMRRIDQANALLMGLETLASGEIQNRIVLNRKMELKILERQVSDVLTKREAGKKEDGNIALKCNWNDRHYKAPCSLSAYNFNVEKGRAWCCSPLNNCRNFKGEVSIQNRPCYESAALKEMFFGAGWNHAEGEKNQPRHIHSVKPGRMAFLTTTPPGAQEKERIIIGGIFIESVTDDPGEETKIYGDKQKSIEIEYNDVQVKFWDFYKNAGNEDFILWGSGLFRYISDNTVLNMLKGIGEQYKNTGRNVEKIIELIRYFEDVAKGTIDV